MKQEQVQARIPADKNSRVDATVRCDMCGMEHKVTVYIETDEDHHDPLITVRIEEPTAKMYPGH